ncbi:MAG: STAS domain-containing protein [Gemmatimonadaceae bacterium]
MVSAYKMVDWKSLAYHFRATRFDAVIVAATALSAVVISVEFCVLIGTFMSFLLTVPRAGRMLLTEFTITDNGQIHERLSSDPPCDRIMIFGLEGELFFGASTALEEHFVTIEKQITAATEFIILRVKRTRNPDAVGIAHIAAFMERMEERGITVLLCGVRREFQQKFERTGLDERWRTNVFLEEPVRQTSTLLAIRHAYRHLKNPCDRCPRRDPDQREQLLYFAI